MTLDIVEITGIEIKPSFIFKPYIIRYNLKLSIGSGNKERIRIIPWQSRFATELESDQFLKRHNQVEYKKLLKARCIEQENLAAAQTITKSQETNFAQQLAAILEHKK